jgi:hypothetical protein
LVVAGGVDGEFAEEFAGAGVHDADVEVVYEQDDVGSGMGSSDTNVVESSVHAQGDGAGNVDAVVADAMVRVGVAGGCGFGSSGVDGRSGCLTAVGDTDMTTSLIGGTSVIQYAVAPGSTELALYQSDPGTCAGTADIGLATVDAAAGSRTLVFAYGADPQHLDLLVLPIAA